MPASPFFLSRESLGDSVLPTATLYPPMASDFPFVSLHHSYSFLAFSPHFICLLGTPRISYVSFLAGVVTVSGAWPYVAMVGRLEPMVSFVTDRKSTRLNS